MVRELFCLSRTHPYKKGSTKFFFVLAKFFSLLFFILNYLDQLNRIHQVAHANTIRGLVKTIDDIGEEEIQDVAIPTGIPVVYKFEKLANGELRSVPPKSQEHSVSQLHMTGQFLEKPGLLKVRFHFLIELLGFLQSFADDLFSTCSALFWLQEALKLEDEWKNRKFLSCGDGMDEFFSMIFSH